MSIKTAIDTAHDMSQPVVLGVGGAVMFGFPIAELIKMGTLVLLCLNIPLAAFRIYRFFKPDDKEV